MRLLNRDYKSFGAFYLGVFLQPRQTFEALILDERRLKFGSAALLINAVLYTLVYIFLSIGNGAPSSFKPWLAIPSDLYYDYNRFMLAPSMIACWILAAGVAQLLSRLFSGQGNFEDTLSVFGFAISIACLASLLHDLPDSFLGAIGVINLREYEIALNSPTIWRTILLILYGLSVIWFLVLFPKGVAAAQRLRRVPAMIVGISAYLIYQTTFLILMIAQFAQKKFIISIPAIAASHSREGGSLFKQAKWMPAFAGMTWVLNTVLTNFSLLLLFLS